MLSDLQAYLRDRQQASLSELAECFHTDASALHGMLDRLIRKARVRKLPVKTCGGCHNCQPESLEVYEWVAGGDRA
ncbi:MAG: sugar metabolism transcriptional regulator [Spirulinaceae cyanobacterium RM2_2_10]|nr:sugar metabolism transcriptional regulator [Spirulinaceae cyanobacterium SM2_1_0]NJO19594.1 sugar metabolism transcriptional regulator [Spirulinaceae cyanobacterium RM2_2_10]